MQQFIYHWFWLDFWTPVWPNVAAIVPTALVGFIWLDIKNEVRHERLEKQMRRDTDGR